MDWCDIQKQRNASKRDMSKGLSRQHSIQQDDGISACQKI